jgi:electron transfer flavoprotein alpha subunit
VKSLRIIVPIKQVPETGKARMDEATGTIRREGVESIVNPLDLYAIETALRLRERCGGTVTALSMGPASAQAALREAVAMGADDAVLLSHRDFAGSDTWATAYALSQAVRRLAAFDLIVCGERATDGDTGQVGPALAAFLDLPPLTYVSAIEDLSDGRVRARRLVENGYEVVSSSLPCLLTVVKEVAQPRLPTLRGKRRARTIDLPVWGPDDIGAERDRIGLNGSPTRVVKISRPKVARAGQRLVVRKPEDLSRTLDGILRFLTDARPEKGIFLVSVQQAPAAGQDPRPEKRSVPFSGGQTLCPAVLFLAEQSRGGIEPVSFELCRWGRALADELGGQLAAVVMGEPFAEDELQSLIRRGADHVHAIEHRALARFLPEPAQRALVDLVERERPEVLLAAATTTGRTLMPYAAARLAVGLTADCTELTIDPENGDLLQTRPAIGGNILATIRSSRRRPQMATVRPHAIAPAPDDPRRTGAISRWRPSDDLMTSRVTCEDLFQQADAGANLRDAQVVVSAGRGIGTERNLGLVRDLAAALGAAVGASREVVDRGWLPYPHQVGLSGKTIRPRLYVALGISGAIQHLAGMQTAERILAVNIDEHAPIFQVADLGIVGDLFQIVPALIERLKAGTTR